MKRLKLFIFLLFVINLVLDAYGQVEHNYAIPPQNSSCDSLKMDQNNLEAALKVIQGTVFRFQQNVSINREVGFKEAAFFSCDNEYGILLVRYHDFVALYLDLPKSMWDKMIQSGNPGDYYERNIKEKFKYWLNKDQVELYK